MVREMDGTSMYKELESKAQVIVDRCNAISDRAGRMTSKTRKVIKTSLGQKMGLDLNALELHQSQVGANMSRLRGMQEDMRRLRIAMIEMEALLVAEQTKIDTATKGQK